MAKRAYEQVIVGEWFAPTKRHVEKCCGCGIIHELEYRINEGQIEVRVTKITKPRKKAGA